MIPDTSVLQLASFLLAKEITPEILTTLQEPSVRKLLVELEPKAEAILSQEWSEDDFEEAAVEFCRLFILNPVVPARAAAWFEEKPGEIASRIQFMIDQGFLTLPAPFDKLTPDHMAVLLVIQGSLGEDDDGQFWADNVQPWIKRFSKALAEKTNSPLYQLTARILKG